MYECRRQPCRHTFVNGRCTKCNMDYKFFCALRFWEFSIEQPYVQFRTCQDCRANTKPCCSPAPHTHHHGAPNVFNIPAEVTVKPPTEVINPNDAITDEAPPTLELVLKEIRQMKKQLSALPKLVSQVSIIKTDLSDIQEYADPGIFEVVLHEIRHLKHQLIGSPNLVADMKTLQQEVNSFKKASVAEQESYKEKIATITAAEQKLFKVEKLKKELKKATDEISALKAEQMAQNEMMKLYIKEIQSRFDSVPEYNKQSQVNCDETESKKDGKENTKETESEKDEKENAKETESEKDEKINTKETEPKKDEKANTNEAESKKDEYLNNNNAQSNEEERVNNDSELQRHLKPAIIFNSGGVKIRMLAEDDYNSDHKILELLCSDEPDDPEYENLMNFAKYFRENQANFRRDFE